MKITHSLLLELMCAAILLCGCSVAQPGDPGAEASWALTWQEQYDLGVRYLSEGNYEGAILAFTAAIEIDPKRAPAYVGRGDAYIGYGETVANLAAAKADYEKAVELDETNAEAYLGMADVYIRQGKYEKAKQILEASLLKIDSQAIEEKLTELNSASITDTAGNVRRINCYDNSGNLIWYHSYDYDKQGREKVAVSYDASGVQTGQIELSYNENGDELVSYAYSRETGILCRIEYEYEGKYKVKTIWYNESGEMEHYNLLQSDRNGNVTREDMYGADGSSWGYYTREYSGKHISRSNYYDPYGNLIEYFTFEYNSKGNQVQYSYYNSGGILQRKHINHYDELGNLQRCEEYDGNGNLIISTVEQDDAE